GNVRTTMRKVQHTIHTIPNSSFTPQTKEDVDQYFNEIKRSLGDTNSRSLSEFKVFPSHESVPRNKTWKITFSHPISTPLPADAVKVLNQDGFPAFVEWSIGEDNTILVKPPLF